MFVLTTIAYPLLLALLCVGAGLLVDRLAGRVLPGVLLAPIGAAALIALSQLSTYVPSIAPFTPVAMGVLALAGFALEAPRLPSRLRELRPYDQRLWLPVLVYVVALAPVLFAGRTSFSAYGVLTDSAFHMMGADYLIRHGQDYAHLDLTNSYGQYIQHYYATGYPSGADTLFGGSASILSLPLIWTFQPFNAFMLALTACPIWLLASPRRLAACLARARDTDRQRPGARLRLRADRVGQGDQRTAAADGDRRPRDAQPTAGCATRRGQCCRSRCCAAPGCRSSASASAPGSRRPRSFSPTSS